MDKQNFGTRMHSDGEPLNVSKMIEESDLSIESKEQLVREFAGMKELKPGCGRMVVEIDNENNVTFKLAGVISEMQISMLVKKSIVACLPAIADYNKMKYIDSLFKEIVDIGLQTLTEV